MTNKTNIQQPEQNITTFSLPLDCFIQYTRYTAYITSENIIYYLFLVSLSVSYIYKLFLNIYINKSDDILQISQEE